MNSRAKGARGEREFAEYLRAKGFSARRGQQFAGGPDSPDVISDLPIHWEVKRVEALQLHPAMAQAIRDCKEGLTPVVAHRRNGGEWLAIMRMDDYLKHHAKH
jgi:Holliday junction resolvase